MYDSKKTLFSQTQQDFMKYIWTQRDYGGMQITSIGLNQIGSQHKGKCEHRLLPLTKKLSVIGSCVEMNN